MKILHVGNHGNINSNDDEGAIAYALRELGHQVVKLSENEKRSSAYYEAADMLLFHKWSDAVSLRFLPEVSALRVCWYFDLVSWPDNELFRRNRQRIDWMRSTLPCVDLMFCTDGDWVAQNCLRFCDQDFGHKLRWLPQGFNERLSLLVPQPLPEENRVEVQGGKIDLLYLGSYLKCGERRQSWVEEVRSTYKDRLYHVSSGAHGQRLVDLVNASRIVLAPDSPVSDRYCSNRAVLITGLGGLLLHPECAWLREQFTDRGERDAGIVFYKDREHMHALIQNYLEDSAQAEKERNKVRETGQRLALRDHTYRTRCAQMMEKVEELIRNRVRKGTGNG